MDYEGFYGGKIPAVVAKVGGAAPVGAQREDKLTSLQTNMVPKMTWRPSKKLSPMMMTVAPPVVQPSLGLMALMQGAAPGRRGGDENVTERPSTTR